MKPIDYFKLQAKNLLRAYKSKTPDFEDEAIRTTRMIQNISI